MPKESQPCHFRFLTAAAILRLVPTPLQPACVSTLTSPCLFSDCLPSHGIIDIGCRPAYITRDSSSQDPETHHIMKNPLSTEGHRHSLRRFHKVPLRKRSFSPHSCPTDIGFLFCSLKYPLSGRFPRNGSHQQTPLKAKGPKNSSTVQVRDLRTGFWNLWLPLCSSIHYSQRTLSIMLAFYKADRY